MSKILSNEINPIAFAEAFTVEPKIRGSPAEEVLSEAFPNVMRFACV